MERRWFGFGLGDEAIDGLLERDRGAKKLSNRPRRLDRANQLETIRLHAQASKPTR